jgi:UDP-N-acetylmuramyl pentapeptide phosphotransferase/UDP-N-acetylglucosamine-1-phosphate transferase
LLRRTKVDGYRFHEQGPSGSQKLHSARTPRVGGIGIFAAVLIAAGVPSLRQIHVGVSRA